jgi:hypothetical protein
MLENKKNRMTNQKPTSNDIYKLLETRSEHQHSKNTINANNMNSRWKGSETGALEFVGSFCLSDINHVARD